MPNIMKFQAYGRLGGIEDLDWVSQGEKNAVIHTLSKFIFFQKMIS